MTQPWTLTLGDCLDPVTGLASLPDKSVTHTITDPPYSAHVDANSMRGHGHRPGGRKQALGFVPMTPEIMRAVAQQIARVTTRWALVFSDLESCHLWRAELADAGMEFIRTGIWIKEFATPQFTGDRPAAPAEAITICHPRGRKRWNGGGKLGAWRSPTAYRNGDDVVHPTQKPVALMRSLIEDFTDAGDLILDPFTGSGTTAAAAVSVGRRFIGWEMSTEHHENARRRLAGEGVRRIEGQQSLL